ncbi:MAG TPA: asparagine synthase (glutamine-hydrolyzing) [Nitrospiraceae bacterium]|nr:asparagine synthase (glutamine-hydrolyzing) [Nitrospiraceae bacterium]
MCAIVGIYNYRSEEPVSQDLIRSMLTHVSHRGPDDEGIFLDGSLGLGHRRLSILDTSAAGHQPMVAPSGRTVISYNGEVYNYVELASELTRLGYVFRSLTDTEVILTQYEMVGEKCLQDFIGMFAFALWDRERRRLLLARDRVGIKPLYWAPTAGGIVFASEIKALLAIPGTYRGVETSAIDPYFCLGYVPGEHTMFQGIFKLLPGHILFVEEGEIRKERYWDLPFESEVQGTPESRAASLRELLVDSVRIHLRSDVPVGVFLSGGLDSSTVTALTRLFNRNELKSFSLAFDMGAPYDERVYARAVAQAFQTEHHEIILTPEKFENLIPRMVQQMEEPVSEASAISFYLIAELASKHVKVVLSGEGADELFGGYDIYRYMQILETMRSIVGPKPFYLLASLAKAWGMPKVERYLALGALPFEQRYSGVSMYGPMSWEEVYTNSFIETLSKNSPANTLVQCYERSRHRDSLSRLLYLDLKTWLPDDILIKADKMTMAHSVELRVPFLDHRVVEFAARVPSAEKSDWWESKRILKRAMHGILPAKILRRKKMGFPTPLEYMFRGPLRGYVRDLLTDRQTQERGYFRKEYFQGLLARLDSNDANVDRRIWQLIVLEEWHKAFVP